MLAGAMAISASGQGSPIGGVAPEQSSPASAVLPHPTVPLSPTNPPASWATPAVQQLLAFKDSDIKFELRELMSTLSDRRHEGWVLAAYPDPNTGRPLIGAGFSLDLPERDHPQRNPLNQHSFVEPSSAQLWQAAGLEPDRLQSILQRYDERIAAWSRKKYRRKISTLSPQITDDEATSLLRISAIQAIANAKAYCANFDQLTAHQQMALSQLVYQMGVNLEEFEQFLNLINNADVQQSGPQTVAETDADHWRAVQQSLVQSQWARLYRSRAVSVIAMFDPQYSEEPNVAQQRISAMLPAVAHRRRGRPAASLQHASYKGHLQKSTRVRSARSRSRKQT